VWSAPRAGGAYSHMISVQNDDGVTNTTFCDPLPNV
jgi:hypothetical protein